VTQDGHTDNNFLRLNGRIYVPKANNLWLWILQYNNDHVVSGHFGRNKTMSLIHRNYVWLNLWTFIIDFCKSCTTCMCSKSQCHKPYGFLKQLLIPEQPWNSISMDFIEQLLDSLGYTAILVIACRLLKQGIFIPTHNTITLADLTKLFNLHVFSKHGVPSHVTSD